MLSDPEESKTDAVRERGEILERLIEFEPAYDKRHADPKKNYGIHGVTMRWLVKGRLGVIQFVVYTNWQLPHVADEFREKFRSKSYPYDSPTLWEPMAADIGYHSPKPMYEGQSVMDGNCQWLGGPCYYDGSSLSAERFFDLLKTRGGDALWKRLEDEYECRFGTPSETGLANLSTEAETGTDLKGET